MRVTFEGSMSLAGTSYADGADYAEMFEWQDGNPRGEDRTGRFVTLEGEYIRLASAKDDYILGVVSAAPALAGNAQGCGWQGMYQRDKWGAVVYEWAEEPGEQAQAVRRQRPKLNPDYDPAIPYLPRARRPEWAAVGMMGRAVVRDDGSCQANGCCRPGSAGIAAASAQGSRVMKRVAADAVLICLK
ncbi:MAG: hypothetical protein FWH26_04875 [Oscillospiraceae bacterium]|nr:hypothetical protein [Oscillospiraceae bacterium]